jgi:hypothetical protein
MAHFAKIDSNNVVTDVLVIDQAEINTGNWGDPASWIQTSYNTYGGIYYTPNTSPRVEDPDQSKALHKNYAFIGAIWLPDGPQGGGFTDAQPYPSWTLNPFSYAWEAPVPMPVPNNPPEYVWNESTLSWDIVPGTDTTAPGSTPNVIG